MTDSDSLWRAVQELSPDRAKAADYMRLAREIGNTPIAGVHACRVAFLSSFSLQFVEPYLKVEGLREEFHFQTYYGPFNQFEQEIMSTSSGLGAFEPDVLVLVMRPEDILPDTVARYYSRHHPDGGFAAPIVARLEECVSEFRRRSSAPVLVANFALPEHTPLGVFDAANPNSLTYGLAAANAALRERISTYSHVYVWDYAGLVATCGARSWTDPRLWAMARIAVAAAHQPALAAHLSRTIGALIRPSAKCLVLDLDNTLWGGVIGDDGIEGIQLGDDYPGNAFKALQREVLGLADRGILLAVVSKNEQEVVEDAFRSHPEMLIRWEELAAVRINWAPKSLNIREIAKDLNIGADAIVFFDDNPVERAEVSANAPEVRVADVPADPVEYVRVLHAIPWFDTPSLSNEDRQRARMYRDEKARESSRSSAPSLKAFLQDLGMIAEVGSVDAGTLARVAQLIGKTNQFNLTTRRHSQATVAEWASDPGSIVAYLRLKDRFGDSGLVAVGIVRAEEGVGTVDTFLMSCRVMGRRVERAFAAYLAERARGLGCHKLIGEYLPTAKNRMVSDLYSSLGFEAAGEIDGGGSRWSLDLDTAGVAWPDVVRRAEVSLAGQQADD